MVNELGLSLMACVRDVTLRVDTNLSEWVDFKKGMIANIYQNKRATRVW